MMKAYVATQKQEVGCWTAEVVSEQDYHQRGPHAHSYCTEPKARPDIARRDAEAWAGRNGYRIVPVECI